uniref:Uncharacterized protein n=1 Tax=Arundo donax TaxID=35708 RepID=A0A0A8YS91_ARUDO
MIGVHCYSQSIYMVIDIVATPDPPSLKLALLEDEQKFKLGVLVGVTHLFDHQYLGK